MNYNFRKLLMPTWYAFTRLNQIRSFQRAWLSVINNEMASEMRIKLNDAHVELEEMKLATYKTN